jgi:hypothetical protein
MKLPVMVFIQGGGESTTNPGTLLLHLLVQWII